MDRTTRNGVLLSFAAYLAYALSDASIKLLEGTLDPFEVCFFGGVLGIAALPFLRRRGESLGQVFVARNRVLWCARGVAAAVGAVGSILAFTRLPMAEAFALIFLLPAFVTLLSVLFLGERVGWRRWAAVGVGFLGVLIVLRPGFRELNLGHLGALVGGFAGAVTIVLLRKLGGSETRLSLYGAGLLGPILGGGVLMIPGFAWPDGRQWLFLAGYGLLAALANVLIMMASARAPASLVAPPQYSQMIWAILMGYLVFGDGLDVFMAVGVAVIIGAGAFTFLREGTRGTRGWRRVPPVHPQ